MLLHRSLALLVALAFSTPLVACDQGAKDSKSKKEKKDKDDEDEDEDGENDKKKKRKGKDEKSSKPAQEDDEPEEKKPEEKKPAAGVEVPGIAGFVVPPGGTHKHVDMPMGEVQMKFENYTYPLKDFPREKLREAFQKQLTDAGWKVSSNGPIEYKVEKGSVAVKVLFGEAGSDETKINVFPPESASATPTPSSSAGGDAVVYAGTYASPWGVVTLEQASAAPTAVTGKYPRGTLKCGANGNKLDCTWTESSNFGRAAFTRDAAGNLNGTWGSGGNATNGGQWNLKLTKAGALK